MTNGAPSPRSRRDPWVGAVVGGRYQMVSKLASGGMGSVYVGRAVGAGGFERRLAVKLLHPHLAESEKFVSMFLDEARLAARIHHPNVVATLDVFAFEGDYFLVMEYVEGLELGRLIHEAILRRVKIPTRVGLRIVLDALAGLTAAHELTDRAGAPLKLVHRDISPQNILVGVDGVSRLTDFGVAKAEDRIHHTMGAEFKGKLAYAAPEQVDRSEVEQRSDLFAIGIVLWEALTHKRLFKAEDRHEIQRMVLGGDYPSPSSVDPSLAPFDAVLRHALEPKLERRVATARLLTDEIHAVASTCGGVSAPTEVTRWVRDLAADFIDERSSIVRRAEEQVPYPSESAVPSMTPSPGAISRSPSGASTRVPTAVLPPEKSAPDHSEVVPASPDPTRISRPKSGVGSSPSRPSGASSDNLEIESVPTLDSDAVLPGEPTRRARQSEPNRPLAGPPTRISGPGSVPPPAMVVSPAPSPYLSAPIPIDSLLGGPTPHETTSPRSITATTTAFEEDARNRTIWPWLLIGAMVLALIGGIALAQLLGAFSGPEVTRPTVTPVAPSTTAPAVTPTPSEPPMPRVERLQVSPTEPTEPTEPTVEPMPAGPSESASVATERPTMRPTAASTMRVAPTMTEVAAPAMTETGPTEMAAPDPGERDPENPYRNL